MKYKRFRKLLCILAVAVFLATCLSIPASATGDVAGAVQNTWKTAQTQIKSIVNNVVLED